MKMKSMYLCCILLLFCATAALANIHVGNKVPLFTGTDLDGKPFDLASVAGKQPMILVFWTSWSKDCAKKIKDLQDKVEKLGKDKITLIGINVGMNDSEERARAFIKENNMQYPNVFDKTGALSEKYQLNKVFAMIMVSKDGTMMMRLNNVPIIDESVLEMLISYVRPAAE